MTDPALHPWDLDPAAARRLQAELRARLSLAWDGRAVSTVGGIDAAVPLGPEGQQVARAAIVVLSFPALEPLEAVTAEVPLTFPYVPGLLSFREAPAILAAWQLLQRRPHLLLVDGQGIAHPRGLGLASHLGLWLGLPTIGVAKSRLYGRHAPPGPAHGDRADLLSQASAAQVIGTVLRTRPRTNPLYVSPGHLIDVPRAAEFALRCVTRYRLPEPTRWAHQVAGGAALPPPPT
ncbi:MAG: deoxyribonuclease V [Anaerolineales bacterium]|nr:deoxyribonuclease V [Anaerolineales bacterium]